MKFSNFLFPESKTPEGDYDVIEESLREAELCLLYTSDAADE